LKIKFIKLTDIEMAKFTVIAILMMIPVINVLARVGLLFIYKFFKELLNLALVFHIFLHFQSIISL